MVMLRLLLLGFVKMVVKLISALLRFSLYSDSLKTIATR